MRIPNITKFIGLFILITILVGVPGLIQPTTRDGVGRVHPELVELARLDPNRKVTVIVQTLPGTSGMESSIAQMGGKITKDLYIINAFSAEMSAQAAVILGKMSGVRWISPDGPMHKSGFTNYTVRDEFTQATFSNNNGTTSWAGTWQEDDVIGAGPSSGNVFISDGRLKLRDNPDTGTFPSAARRVNLSSAVNFATLSFDFRTSAGVDPDDKAIVEVSSDGGMTYTTLEVFTFFQGLNNGSRSYNLMPYASPNTSIRFRILEFYGGSQELFNVDNLQVSFDQYSPQYANTYLTTTGADLVHNQGLSGMGISVAVIDSGVANHPDLNNRLIASPFGSDDLYGHGTHVAGIIGGDGNLAYGSYKGMAPGVNIINLLVTDAAGMAYESDVVNALQWVFENKEFYNIRVINLSLNSSIEDSYHNSPLDAAVEIMWFNSIVVVVSAGNKGPAGGYNTIRTAPANDPFVITVGAADEHGTSDYLDDTYAPFSSFGVTLDGFNKPDILAPGYMIVSALSDSSTWDNSYPERVVDQYYIRLSGTSMAAPMVSGAVALLLQDEPNLTPDQVKYRLLNSTSRILSNDAGNVPYLDVYAVVNGTTSESSNNDLTASQLLWTGSDPITWGSVAWNSVAWNSVAWNSVAWNSVAWNSVSLDGIFWGRGRDK